VREEVVVPRHPHRSAGAHPQSLPPRPRPGCGNRFRHFRTGTERRNQHGGGIPPRGTRGPVADGPPVAPLTAGPPSRIDGHQAVAPPFIDGDRSTPPGGDVGSAILGPAPNGGTGRFGRFSEANSTTPAGWGLEPRCRTSGDPHGPLVPLVGCPRARRRHPRRPLDGPAGHRRPARHRRGRRPGGPAVLDAGRRGEGCGPSRRCRARARSPSSRRPTRRSRAAGRDRRDAPRRERLAAAAILSYHVLPAGKPTRRVARP
jgi:hypothetical protein